MLLIRSAKEKGKTENRSFNPLIQVYAFNPLHDKDIYLAGDKSFNPLIQVYAFNKNIIERSKPNWY